MRLICTFQALNGVAEHERSTRRAHKADIVCIYVSSMYNISNDVGMICHVVLNPINRPTQPPSLPFLRLW